MQQIRDVVELLLLVGLALIQVARWTQKTEDAPSEALRTANEAKRRAESAQAEVRAHKRTWQEYLNTRFITYDRTYARKREVELQLQNMRDKQDNDCDRITALEEKLERLAGV